MPGPGVEISYQELTADGVRKRHYPLTAPQDFTIPNGTDGSAVTPITLPANCRVIGVCCPDCTGFAASTAMSAEICFDNEASSPMYDLYEQDDPSTVWSQGDLPTTGTLAFILTHAFRARRIRFVLDKNTDANIVLKVYGFDGVI